ncbi:MAG: galactose oxidase-like domain-containing protein [Candidatus Polarisedimenticolia bacterium]
MLPRIGLRVPVVALALILVVAGLQLAGATSERLQLPVDVEEPLIQNAGPDIAWRTTVDPLVDDPVQYGQWALPMDWPANAVHSILLRTGKVLWFRGDEDSPVSYVWDPATNQLESQSVDEIIWCGGNSVLDDGRVLITGGASFQGASTGPRHSYLFDPVTLEWTRTVDMRKGRYYPTNVLLGDGRTLVFSGTDANGLTNNQVEAFVPGTTFDTWQLLVGAERSISYYPRMHLLPTGQVAHVGPDKTTSLFDPSSKTWQSLGNSQYGNRTHGSSVMLPPGHRKIMILGGHDRGLSDPRATNTVEILDMSAPTPRWVYANPMASRRMHLQSVILPDGKVLAIGGTTDEDITPAYATEMFNPSTGTWTTMASQRTRRGYHSSAILLPDGRVLSAGTNGNNTAEIYSPPYLFRGPRPVIGSIPSSVNHSATMTVGSLDAASITSVVLMRPGASTHAINMEQRYVPLTFSQTGPSSLSVTAPLDTNVAPPGYYMLFLVNSSGIPSVARFVRLGASTGGNQRPVVDAGPGATIVLPATGTLGGSVSDDGLPSPALTMTWSKESGPGSVAFSPPGAAQSQASFSEIGTYVLRLTATDGQLAGTDTVSFTVNDGVSGGYPFETRIAAGADDVEEKAGGSIYLDSTDLEMTLDSDVQTIGLRFPGLPMPPGERIVTAWLQFKTDEATSGTTSLQIQAQDSDNALPFTTASHNVTTRPVTQTSVSWNLPAWLTVGEVGPDQRTPDLSAVIQQVVNRPGWSGGNALALIIRGSGKRVAKAYEGLASGAAVLHIETGAPPPNHVPIVDPGPELTVRMPRSAVLDGTVTDDGLPAPPGTVQTLWVKESGPITGVVTFANPQAIDTSATFSEPGRYVLELQADDGELVGRGAVSIQVTPPIPGLVILDRSVPSGTSDAYEGGKGKVFLTQGQVPLGGTKAGIRFTNVTIPRGSTIYGATLQFQADRVDVAGTSLVVRGQASDNAAAFDTTSFSISTRPKTAASVAWAPLAWLVAGEASDRQRPPDLAAIVQEIVNRAGWNSGNALAIIITGNGRRTAESFEGGATAAPRLTIEYVAP